MINWTVETFDQVGSTSDIVKQKCGTSHNGVPHGFVARAQAQTGGRGRLGRVWQSPLGNLYQSFCVAPDVTLGDASGLAFVSALAVLHGVKKLRADLPVTLKWPNDVLIQGAKVAGILIEAGPIEGDKASYYVVGLGVNVASAPELPAAASPESFSQSPYRLAALADFSCHAAPDLLGDHILVAFSDFYAQWQAEGFAPIRAAWQDVCGHMNQEVSVGPPDGRVQGVCVGLDADGALLVEVGGDTMRVTTGEVALISLPQSSV